MHQLCCGEIFVYKIIQRRGGMLAFALTVLTFKTTTAVKVKVATVVERTRQHICALKPCVQKTRFVSQ